MPSTPITPIATPAPTPIQRAATQRIPVIGPNGPDPSPAVVARLRGSDPARQIFALQSLLYAYKFTDAAPDGVEGPVTDGLIGQINRLGSYTNEPARFTARSLGNAAGVMSQRGNPVRVIPFTLPSDVINSVNTTIARTSSIAPQLQVMPTTVPSQEDQFALAGQQGQTFLGNAARAVLPAGRVRSAGPSHSIAGRPVSPAGQVVPLAGFSRPLTVQPINSVGSQPGGGYLTDPRGMNIGLWEAMEGWLHNPLGTGVVAADVEQNPIAGQVGNYWAGYR